MDGSGPVIAPLAPFGQQLIEAAKHGTIERVGALLDQGVAVDSRDANQNTPLIWACRQGTELSSLCLSKEGRMSMPRVLADALPLKRHL